MSNPKKENPSPAEKAPSFEVALEELETMVDTMESGQLPLEKLITHYERGAALISHCEAVLDDARKRLELITLKPSTQSKEGPRNNSTQESSTESTQESNDNNDDEIRLF
ncbi:MAG: exodeoxyribonuclease VII small subunit [Verrucomicrobiae bacterium]|nr:exodeoxyribonuclease VII small subunit [Verrucomicrobiae bacterium]NNJ44088.1 exodeoxyribonuclease VII small subunit [Akkermansiaceae bacterium]